MCLKPPTRLSRFTLGISILLKNGMQSIFMPEMVLAENSEVSRCPRDQLPQWMIMIQCNMNVRLLFFGWWDIRTPLIDTHPETMRWSVGSFDVWGPCKMVFSIRWNCHGAMFPPGVEKI